MVTYLVDFAFAQLFEFDANQRIRKDLWHALEKKILKLRSKDYKCLDGQPYSKTRRLRIQFNRCKDTKEFMMKMLQAPISWYERHEGKADNPAKIHSQDTTQKWVVARSSANDTNTSSKISYAESVNQIKAAVL